MGAASVRPAGPTQPLDFVGSKGSIRQLADGSWATWNGHDWVPTVVPAGQIAGSSSYVQKLADGAVQLSNGLYVTGTAAETNNSDSLWIAGNSHTTGNYTVDGNAYVGQDVRATADNLLLSKAGQGLMFTSSSNSTSGWTPVGNTTPVYSGIGVVWTHSATRIYELRARITLSISGGATNTDTVARIQGGVWTGSVNMSDPVKIEDLKHIGASGDATHRFSWLVRPADFTTGQQIYMMISYTYYNTATNSQVLMWGLDPHPTVMEKWDVGAA